MKKQWIIACLSGIFAISVQAQQPNKFPYQDTSLTADQRADDLLQRLTAEEKVALMQNNSPAIPRLGIKPYEWWNEALHGVARAGLATVFPQAIGMLPPQPYGAEPTLNAETATTALRKPSKKDLSMKNRSTFLSADCLQPASNWVK